MKKGQITIIKENHKVEKQIDLPELLNICKTCKTDTPKGTLGGYTPAVILRNKRTTDDILEYTGLYGFDIDINDKDDADLEQIKKDLDLLIDRYISIDMLFWKRSASKKGIHFIAKGQKATNIDEYKYVWNYIGKDVEEALLKLGLSSKYRNDTACQDPVRQFYINHDAEADINDVPIKYDNIEYISVKEYTDLNIKVDIGKQNSICLKELMKINIEKGERLRKLNKYISTQPLNYGDGGNFFMIKKLPLWAKKFFYNIYLTYYPKNHTLWRNGALKNFDSFNSFINSFKLKGDRQKTLYSFFDGSKIFGLDRHIYETEKGYDFFKHKYDSSFEVVKYIDEKYDLIVNEFINGINVLRAPAGAGKTTLIQEYIEDKFKDKNVLFLSLKTPLLDQQYGEYIESGFNLHKNYNGIKTEIKSPKNNIVFSTIHSFDKIREIDFDLIVFDEAHLLVDYSSMVDFEYNFIDLYEILHTNIQQVYISATPEKFIMSLYDLKYKYINIDIRNYIKTEINLEYTNNTKKKLYDLLDTHTGLTNVVYLNDKKGIDNIVEEKITDGAIITAETKEDKEFLKIIKDQEVNTALTYITTSILSEGLNIKNDAEFNLFILDNYTTHIENIYQFVNRFRERKVNVYYITKSPFSKEGYENLYDFNIFKYSYAEILMIMKSLKYSPNKESIIKNKYIIEDFINRFYIGNEVYKDYTKHLHFNPLYNREYIKWFFDIKSFSKVKEDKGFKFPSNIKIDDDISCSYITYKRLWAILEASGMDQDEITEELIISLGFDFDEYILKFLKGTYYTYGGILRRILKQEETINDLNSKFLKVGLEPLNIEDYIFLSDISFKNKEDELRVLLVKHTPIDTLSSYDTAIKLELDKTYQWILENKKSTKKYEYIGTEELKEYMLENNIIVKGKNWVRPMADYINGENKRVEIMKQKQYVIKW